MNKGDIMYAKLANHLLLGIGICIFLAGVPDSTKAADTKLSGYVYEFDEKYQNQNALGKVTVKVKSKEGTKIDEKQTDNKNNKGYYEIMTTSENDLLTFIYSLKGYNPYPKRVVQNDLKDKTLASVALVKIPENAQEYKATELVHLSQAVVEVMLIFKPTKELIGMAIFLSDQLYRADPKQKMQAVSIDPSTFFNIDRLMPTNLWLKEDFFVDYLKEFKKIF